MTEIEREVDNRGWLYVLLAALLVLATRLPFLEPSFVVNSVDSFAFSSAAEFYDVRNFRPHLPGYYLYVMLIRILNELTGLGQTSQLLVSVGAEMAAAGVFMSWLLKRGWSTATKWMLWGVLFLNPSVWFYGFVSEIYALDLLTSCVLLWLSDKPYGGRLAFVWLMFMAGFRQSTGVLLLPMVLFMWWKTRKKYPDKDLDIVTLVSGLFIFFWWMVPILRSAGGVGEYIELYSTKSPTAHFGVLANMVNYFSYMLVWGIPFIPLKMSWLIKKKDEGTKIGMTMGALLLGIAIPILFFLLYHYAKGYILLVLPLALALFIAEGVSNRALISSIVLSIAIFFFTPFIEPSYETNMSRETRSLSKWEVFLERTLSINNTTASLITGKSELWEDYDKMIAELPKLNEKRLWIDRSNFFNIGEYAYRYPDLNFYKIELRSEGNLYSRFDGWNVEERLLRRRLLENALFIGKSDFIENHLAGYANVLIEEEETGLSIYTPIDAQRFYQRYIYLFEGGDEQASHKEALIP